MLARSSPSQGHPQNPSSQDIWLPVSHPHVQYSPGLVLTHHLPSVDAFLCARLLAKDHLKHSGQASLRSPSLETSSSFLTADEELCATPGSCCCLMVRHHKEEEKEEEEEQLLVYQLVWPCRCLTLAAHQVLLA